MKKIFPYIFGILSIFCFGIIAGCGEKPQYNLSFEKSYIEMSIGDTLDLSTSVKIDNAEVKDIKFATLDAGVVSISGQTITAVNYGTTMVTAEYDTSYSYMEVKVFAKPMQSDTPNGIVYNEQTNSISWNKVMVKIEDSIQEITSYTLLVSHNNEQAKEISVKNSNSYVLEEGGLYDIKVKCDAIKINGQEIYSGSNYSESYVVRKLSSPKNISYNDETEILSWDCDEDVSEFKVVVNGVSYPKTTEKQFAIDLYNPNEMNVQEYKVQVNAVSYKNTNENVVVNKVAVGRSAEVVWKRLYAPQISISNGLVTWDNSLVGDFHYVIITKSGNSTISRDVEQNNFDVSNIITPGQYNEISLKAVSDSKDYLSSKNESKVENITKLTATTLSFDPQTKTISASNYLDKNIELSIVFKSKTEKVSLNSDGKYVFDKTEEGTYEISAIVKAQNDNEVQSNESNVISLTNLAKLDVNTITQRVEDERYYLDHSESADIDLYEYYITFNNATTPLNRLSNGSFGVIDVLFHDVGEYTISIKSLKNQDLGNGKYYLSSYTTVKVVRQEDLTVTNNVDDKIISWETTPVASGYEYYINKDNQAFEQIKQTTENQYSYSSYEYGNYDFYVKAKGSNSVGCLYLDSLHYVKQSFEMLYKLQSPEISFDRQTKIVTIAKDLLATDYEIQFDDVILTYDDSAETISIDLTDKITTAKTYTFMVRAKNEANALIKPSDYSTIQITKLVSPTNYYLSKDGVLQVTTSVDPSSLAEQKTYVTINDEQTLTLDKTNSNFVVRAKFLANPNRVNDMYYLDSDFETFNISRLQTPQKPILDDAILSWDTINYSNFIYKLTFTQGDIIKIASVSKAIESIDVLTDENLSGIDKTKDFYANIQYEYQGGNLDLSGTRDFKFSSLTSEQALIHKLKSDKTMVVSENEGVVKVTWEASEIEGATYELKFKADTDEDFVVLYTGTNPEFIITDKVQEEGKYTLRLKITKQGYISSEFVDAYVERLKNVEQISIDENEEISVQTDYTKAEYVVGDDSKLHKVMQLDKIEIMSNGQEITNLNNQTGRFAVSVKLIAARYTSGEYYYLDSKERVFNFSRVSTLDAPIVNDNQITWAKVEDNKYMLKFTAGDLVEYLGILNNTISTNDTKIQDIITKLNSNTISVCVKVDIDQFVALANGEEYKLSSNYSNSVEFIKLEIVSNIVISSTDDAVKQERLKISWDYDDSNAQVKQYIISLYKNDTLIRDNITSQGKFIYIDDAKEDGKYYVQIKVVGQNNYIDSNYAKSNIVTRLKSPINITISQDGIISFTGIENAKSYYIEYYHGDDFKGKIDNISTTTYDMQELLYGNTFFGDVSIKVIAVGGQGIDEYQTLSSPFSTEYVFTKAKEANVRIFVDKLIAGGENAEEIDSDSVYLITISTKQGRVVKELELKYGKEYYFEDFAYVDSSTLVDTSIEQTFVIKSVRRVNLENYVLSNSTRKEVTKLSDVQNFGFIRKTNGIDSSIYIQGNIDNNANKYILKIKDLDDVINDFVLGTDKFEKLLDIDLLQKLPENFTISIYKQGMINENGTSYINSSSIVISGKKLAQNKKLETNNGKLVWNQIDDASDYVLRVKDSKETTILTGFVNNNVHTLSSELAGKVGLLKVNIKALGNVGSTLKTENIILDSTYILAEQVDEETKETTTIEKDYDCKKLSIPTNYKVIEGYITFKAPENNLSYVSVVDGNEYELSFVPTEQTDYVVTYSDSMYNELLENKAYNVSIRAKSSAKDIIYSDLTSTLKMKIMANNSKDSLAVNFKTLSQNPLKYDYTINEITWDKDTNAQNGYILNYGNVISYSNDEIFLPNKDTLKEGMYNFKMAVRGNSTADSDGCYHLNSKYSKSLQVYKLGTVDIKVNGGKITWKTVVMATGYLIYLDGNIYSETPLDGTETELENWSDYKDHKLEMRAISSDSMFMCGNIAEYTIEKKDDSGETTEVVQNVSKLEAPESLEVENGAFVWNIKNKFSLSELLSLSKGNRIRRQATISVQSLYSDKVTLRFSDMASGATYAYTHDLVDFINISQEVRDQVKSLAGTVGADINLDDFQYLGWPTVENGYYEVGKDLPSGTYNLYLKQSGDNVSYITSNFGSAQEIYVPYAPRIKMIYENNSFKLTWDKITIPSKYGINNPTYKVIVEGKTKNEEGKDIVRRKVLGQTTDLKFDLSSYIQNGELTSDYTRIYVFVSGDNSKVINGKLSNVIEMKVLNKTTAYVSSGEMYWNSQESATEYLVTYKKSTEQVSKQLTLTKAFWDCSELESGVEYDVNIQAIGLRIASTTQATLTGKDSSVGKVVKLYDPESKVDCGIFSWKQIENASSYEINTYINNKKQENVKISNIADENSNINYETTFADENILYRFKAIGDLKTEMNEDTIAYVNSNETEGIYGTVLTSLENILAKDGKLTWEIVNNNGLNVTSYKLIFNKVDKDGNISDSEYIVTGSSFKDIDNLSKYAYDCSDLDSGRYQVTIQAYYENNKQERIYSYNGSTAYYLMGLIEQEYVFEKYSKVQGQNGTQGVVLDNVIINDGEFSWEYSGELEEVNYDYELVFTSTTGAVKTFVCSDPRFFGNIVDSLTLEETFTLKVRVIPKKDVEDFISSNYITFINVNAYDSEIVYQLNGVKESDILLSKSGDSDSLYINWGKYVVSSGTTNLSESMQVKYRIVYWSEHDGVTSEKQEIIVQDTKIDTNRFEFDITSEFTLYYQIQVLPLGTLSYVPSALSEIRDIKKPKSVAEVFYDEEKMYYYWSTEGTSNDHSFKIRDEVLAMNEDGELILDSDGNPIVVRTYTFITKDNTTNTYIPVELGYHKVSVAVVVRTSGDEGSLTSSYTYYNNSDTRTLINLFEIGEVNANVYGSLGTTDNPYLITNETQFANIRYRLDKPSYQNSYILTQNGVETKVTLSGQDNYFNFKQTCDISNVTPFGMVKNKNEESVIFKGVYDGNYKQLTWNCELDQMRLLVRKNISLFSEISSTGKVMNLKVIANYTGKLTVAGTISMICTTNSGTISNLIIGTMTSSISIQDQDVFWFGVCNENKGSITNVVNYYSVTLSSQSKSTRMGYAGIANKNTGTVSRCANYGNIEICSINATVGGIVATNEGVVERCVLKNTSSKITMPKVSDTAIVYFGGIVGNNATSGTISYSYTYTNTTVYRYASNTSNDKVYIAGLVGYSANDKISRSYVYNKITAQSSQNVQIGSIYMFAYIANVQSSSDTYCYCNQRETYSPIGGSTQFSIQEYSNKPSGTDLNKGGDAYYVANESNFPSLVWETEFDNLWKENTAV